MVKKALQDKTSSPHVFLPCFCWIGKQK